MIKSGRGKSIILPPRFYTNVGGGVTPPETFNSPVVNYASQGTLLFDLDPRDGGSTIDVDGSNFINEMYDANGSGRKIVKITGKNGFKSGTRTHAGENVIDMDGSTDSVMDMLSYFPEMGNLVNGALTIFTVAAYDQNTSTDLYLGAEVSGGADRAQLGLFRQWIYNTAVGAAPFNDLNPHIVSTVRSSTQLKSKHDGVDYTNNPGSSSNTATLATVTLGGQNETGQSSANGYIKRMLVYSGELSDTVINDIRRSLSYEHKIPQPDDDYLVFIIAGQSNAAGKSGEAIPSASQPYHPYILQVDRDGSFDKKIILAEQELQFAGSQDGICFGMEFAQIRLAAKPNTKMILVPTAEGSTSFSGGDWTYNTGANYIDTVDRANAAMSYGTGTKTIGGMLWHQGEYDVSMSQVDYTNALIAAFNGFRADITGASAMPIVMGDLAPDFTTSGHLNVRAAIADMPNQLTKIAVAASTGLATVDGIHFDTDSLLTFGARYEEQWRSIA